PADIKFKWNNISWKNMAGMCDRLIHNYMGVNYSIVWVVVKNIIPEIRTEIQKIIGQNSEKS
ncbi:MAG: HepT-like ribonuclease domain-containing protein, partial [Candidatus Buchananbacteria bacterium]